MQNNAVAKTDTSLPPLQPRETPEKPYAALETPEGADIDNKRERVEMVRL